MVQTPFQKMEVQVQRICLMTLTHWSKQSVRKFEPTNFVICEVPPVLQNEEMKQKITEFNELIHEKFDEGFTVPYI